LVSVTDILLLSGVLVVTHVLHQLRVPLLSHQLLVLVRSEPVPVRKLISLLVNFTLCCKWVSLLMVQIFLQIEESVKEDRGHLTSFQVLQGNLVFSCRPNHIQHLTKTVIVGQGLDTELFHPLELLLVEELELVHGENAVTVQVHTAEPVLDSCGVPLVLLRQEEPDKLCVGHPAFLLSSSPGDGPGEYPLYHPCAQSVLIVTGQVLSVNKQS